MTEDKKTFTEEIRTTGEELLAKVKELVHEGNVRRIIVKDEEEKTLIEIPLTLGVVGVLWRRGAIRILMSIELMLNAANLNFIAFWRYGPQAETLPGLIFVIFSIGIAAAEAAVGLAIIIAIFRGRESVDADALNLLAQEPLRRGDWILTPHPAEAGRLLGCSAGEIQADRVGAAQRLAARYQAVVVLKGCGTVVADADGRYAICPLGNPGMATAGSGDVLSGVIGAMLAQGLSPWQAAQAGVVAHAAAGDLAAEQHGQRGLLASDISAFLPLVLNPV